MFRAIAVIILIFLAIFTAVAVQTATAVAAADGLLQFKAGNHVLGFAPTKAYLAAIDHALTVEFLGTKGVMPKSEENSSSGASSKTKQLGKIVYSNLWPGIKLVYSATKDGITESTYHVAPGADVSQIRLKYNVPVELQKDGTLKFKFAKGYITEAAPVAWQGVDGKKIPVRIEYRLSGGTVGFKVGDYDKAKQLVIDPTYQWHTFYGSMLSDAATSIAIDGSGNVYVAGHSMYGWQGGNNTDPLHPFGGTQDIFVLKLNSAGQYQWHTFYGISDRACAMAIDGSGNVYVTGISYASWQGDSSKDPLHPFSGGINGMDIIVMKLNSDGHYVWHTFYGGYLDQGNAIAVDGDNAYITGMSDQEWTGDSGESPIHPHSGSGDREIFVLKLAGSGQYLWHTYYGSPANKDVGQGITVSGGNVFVTGYSQGAWLGDNDAQPLHYSSYGNDSIFVLKLTGNGHYQWHTFYGDGTSSLFGETYGTGITADGTGNLYITGNSYSAWQGPGNHLPLHPFTGGPYDYDYDMFVLKLDGGGGYQWHTFYPGAADAYYGLAGYAITSDMSGDLYVAGGSRASWQGVGNATPLHPYNYLNDIVILALNGSGLYQWHTFYGSDTDDWGNSIALDGSGSVYVAGNSGDGWSADNNVAPLHPYNYNWGVADAFILKIAEKAPIVTTAAVSSITSSGAISGGTVTSAGLPVSARGVCWSIYADPALSDTCTHDGAAAGSFTSSITGLTQNMTYHVRAYATNAAGTGYGNDVQFTASAISNKVNLVIAMAGTGAGTITGTPGISCSASACIMTFDSGTAISVAAAAANGSAFKWFSTTGSAASCSPYSNSCQFAITTDSSITANFFALPAVITMPVTDIASRTATSGGFVTSGGGYSVNFRGVCWGKSINPVKGTDTCTSDGSGAGRYYSSLTLLSPNTIYHVRAYAQTSYGIGYGADLQFTTAPAAPMAYVSNLGRNGVEMIDTGSNSWTGWLATGSAPYGVAVNPLETRVYVANSGIDKVSIIDTGSNTVLTSVSVGRSPMGVASNMTDSRVYAANNIGNTVSVIDTGTNTVISTIPVGNGPNGIAVSPDGNRVYVANTTDGSVSVIDTATNAVSGTVTQVGGSGSGPFGVAISPDGTRVYTSNSQGNSVSVIDATALSVVGAPIAVGSAPYGIAVNPDGSRVFVANKNSSSVSVVDTATNTVIGSPIGVGGSPRGVAFTPDGARAYVANYQTNNISVIDTSSNTVTATINVWNNPIGFGQFIRPPASCSIKLVKLAGLYYLTIHEAYAAVTTDGQILQMQTTDFAEPDFNLNKSMTVTLRGGYGCDFTIISGYTTVHGKVTIGGGMVTVDNIIIQ